MPPAPNPNAKRRNARVGPVVLPSEGRTGDVPRWPLALQSADEADLWDYLWHLPHAVQWERMRMTRTVARYCRTALFAEEPGAPPAIHAQVTAMEDRLGLNPKALRALMWEVAVDEVAEHRAERAATVNRIASVRDRIRAVE